MYISYIHNAYVLLTILPSTNAYVFSSNRTVSWCTNVHFAHEHSWRPNRTQGIWTERIHNTKKPRNNISATRVTKDSQRPAVLHDTKRATIRMQNTDSNVRIKIVSGRGATTMQTTKRTWVHIAVKNRLNVTSATRASHPNKVWRGTVWVTLHTKKYRAPSHQNVNIHSAQLSFYMSIFKANTRGGLCTVACAKRGLKTGHNWRYM